MTRNLLRLAIVLLAAACLSQAGCRRGARPGTLVIAIEQPPHGFDPRFSTNFSQSAHIMQLVFDTLLVKDEHFDLIPSLAQSYQQSDDSTTFTFHLRPGVKFHNGKPLTSADVKYTFASILAPATKSPIRGALDRLKQIDCPDDSTVVFTAREPFYSFLGNLPAIGIIPDASGDQPVGIPIGTGPYRFVSYAEGQPVKLDANMDYWSGAPGIPHLEVDVITDNSTRQAAIMSGEVDLAYNAQFDPETVRALKRRAGINVDVEAGANIGYLGVNVTAPFLSNSKVRQAVAYAIDRAAIIHGLLRDQAIVANSVLPVGQWACDKDLKGYGYDPQAARRLLDEAGFPSPGDASAGQGYPSASTSSSAPAGSADSYRFKLTLLTTTNQLSRNIGAIIQDQLRQVGIQLDLQSLEPATFFDDLSKAQFDLYYLIGVGGNQSTDIFQFTYYSRYHNDEFNAAITKLRSTTDPAAMKPMFTVIASILARRDYCPNPTVDKLTAEAAALDSPADANKIKSLYLNIAGILTDRGGANRSRYCNPQVDQWITDAEPAKTRDVQQQYHKIQQTLLSDLPQIYLWYPDNVLIARSRVTGVHIDPSGAWFFISRLTLSEK